MLEAVIGGAVGVAMLFMIALFIGGGNDDE